MKETMLQQVMNKPHDIQYRVVAIPEVKPNQVMIKIKRIGICGSDIHVYHGKHPYVTYPLTQGHEVSGQIAVVGKEVTGLIIGQKVTIEPQYYCGSCYSCEHGQYNLCEYLEVMGFQISGTASEYFVVDASKVTVLPDTMTYDQGAMIEPLAVTVHACRQAGDLKGKKVVVLGAGPIGILLCQVLKALGTLEVLVTDISQHRLDLAKCCGADHIVNTKLENYSSALDSIYGKDKADYIFDCAGNDVTMGQAINNARKGSKIMLVAVFAEMANVDLAKLNDSELTISTSMMYRHEDYLDAIMLVEDHKVQLEPLMSKYFGFSAYNEAYKYIEKNYEKTMKVLINMDITEEE